MWPPRLKPFNPTAILTFVIIILVVFLIVLPPMTTSKQPTVQFCLPLTMVDVESVLQTSALPLGSIHVMHQLRSFSPPRSCPLCECAPVCTRPVPRSLWAASVFLFLGTTLLRTFLYTLYVSNSFSGCKLGVGLPACPVLLGNVRLFPAATWNTECFLITRTLVFGLRL